MPGRKRQTKKVKNHNKKQREVTKLVHQLIVPRIKPALSNFPQHKRMKFFATINYAFNVAAGLIGGNGQDIVFRHNGIYQIGPSVIYPLNGLPASRTNFSLFPNYPAGAQYMMGTERVNGSNGIYNQYIVHKSKLDVEICPTTVAGAVNASALEVVISGMQDESISYSDTTTQRSEYPLTHRFVLPQTQTAKVFRYRKTYTTGQVFGLDQEPTSSSGNYIAGSTGNPILSEQSSWFIRIANLDGSTAAYNGSLRATITFWVDMFDINTLLSGPPT